MSFLFSFSSDYDYPIEDTRYILKLYASIITSEQCRLCQKETLHSIETESLPFTIHQSNGASVTVALHNPSIHNDGMLDILTNKKTKRLNVFSFVNFC